jgi:hypothetical protein
MMAVPRLKPAPRSKEQQRVDDEFPELADLALLLDSRWRIPGTGIRFGADALAGLLPVVGDSAAGLISAYIIYKAHRLGASKRMMARMVGNVAIDTVFGSIPIVGTVFDVVYKSNNRNVRLLRRHLEERGKRLPMPGPGQEDEPGEPR